MRNHQTHSLRKKCMYSEVILVPIFPAFSFIRTEYGEILRIYPYSVRMRENVGKMRTRITPNMDTFYAVININSIRNTCDYFITITKGNVEVLMKSEISTDKFFLLCNSTLTDRIFLCQVEMLQVVF